MPLEVLGRTRTTMMHAKSFPNPTGEGNLLNVHLAWDRSL